MTATPPNSRLFLNAFHPLVGTPKGREAVKERRELPFVDASCRREPDFESAKPSITALCRAGHFAPRLMVGDYIVYLTIKGKYHPHHEEHWRLVAVLKVEGKLYSHPAAAAWYRSASLPLPRNLMVPANPAVEIDRTERRHSTTEEWDVEYWKRSKRYPMVLVCAATFLELSDPPAVFEQDLIHAFGRVPGLRNPPEVTLAQVQTLVAPFGIRVP